MAPTLALVLSLIWRIDRPAAGDPAGALEETLRAYAALLESFLLAVPAQYDWSRIEVDP